MKDGLLLVSKHVGLSLPLKPKRTFSDFFPPKHEFSQNKCFLKNASVQAHHHEILILI